VARQKLALRAERAMGLTALPVPRRAKISKISKVSAVAPPAIKPKLPIIKPALVIARADASSVSAPKIAPSLFVMPSEPFTTAVLSREAKTQTLQQLDDGEVKGCKKCRLCETRMHTVFGEGDVDARLLFIGEGPGENEDLQGRPFVGRAGELLEKMIVAMGLSRQSVFICNIVKCRPPGNRAPMADETGACTPYLLQQIEVVRPTVIVTLGLPATQFMLQTKNSMGKMRGQWHTWRGIKLMPTYHPAYVLRDYTPKTRAAVWDDLKQVMAELGLPTVAKKS